MHTLRVLKVRLLNFRLSWIVNKCHRNGETCWGWKINVWFGEFGLFKHICKHSSATRGVGTSHQPAAKCNLFAADAKTMYCSCWVHRASSSLWQEIKRRSEALGRADLAGWRIGGGVWFTGGFIRPVIRDHDLWTRKALLSPPGHNREFCLFKSELYFFAGLIWFWNKLQNCMYLKSCISFIAHQIHCIHTHLYPADNSGKIYCTLEVVSGGIILMKTGEIVLCWLFLQHWAQEKKRKKLPQGDNKVYRIVSEVTGSEGGAAVVAVVLLCVAVGPVDEHLWPRCRVHSHLHRIRYSGRVSCWCCTCVCSAELGRLDGSYTELLLQRTWVQVPFVTQSQEWFVKSYDFNIYMF